MSSGVVCRQKPRLLPNAQSALSPVSKSCLHGTRFWHRLSRFPYREHFSTETSDFFLPSKLSSVSGKKLMSFLRTFSLHGTTAPQGWFAAGSFASPNLQMTPGVICTQGWFAPFHENLGYIIIMIQEYNQRQYKSEMK